MVDVHMKPVLLAINLQDVDGVMQDLLELGVKLLERIILALDAVYSLLVLVKFLVNFEQTVEVVSMEIMDVSGVQMAQEVVPVLALKVVNLPSSKIPINAHLHQQQVLVLF